MIRTRLLWFTLGFASASAAMGQFIFRELWADRNNLSSQVAEEFSPLETRVKNLEGFLTTNSSSNANSGAGNLK